MATLESNLVMDGDYIGYIDRCHSILKEPNLFIKAANKRLMLETTRKIKYVISKIIQNLMKWSKYSKNDMFERITCVRLTPSWCLQNKWTKFLLNVDVIKLFWRKSTFRHNKEMKRFPCCLSLHKNVKQCYFSSKKYTQNSLSILKWPILVVLVMGEIFLGRCERFPPKYVL